MSLYVGGSNGDLIRRPLASSSSQEVALSCSGSIMNFNSKLSKGLVASHGQMDERSQED